MLFRVTGVTSGSHSHGESDEAGGGGMTEEMELGSKYLTALVMADLHAFQAKQERELTPEERMSFIAGHFRGFVLGRKVGETAT
jgi:hypothetical protein